MKPRIFKRGSFWWCRGAALVPCNRSVYLRTLTWCGDSPAAAFTRWTAITTGFVESYKSGAGVSLPAANQ